MKYISLCSGIEAASVAFIPIGWKPLAFSEIEPFPCAVLKHKYPDVPNHGDLSKYDWGGYRGKADLVCAGFPCQAFSIAGLRNSVEDSRGNLSIIGIRAIKSIRPRWVLLEQVPGVFSAPGNAFGCILAGLSGADEPLLPGTEDGKWRSAGIVSGPEYGLAWRVLNAEFFGVPQRRERVFIIGYLGDWRRAAQVLFEPNGLPGYSAESCQEGQATAGEAAGGAGADSKPLAFKIRQGKSGGGKGYLGSEDKAFTVATGNDQNLMIPIQDGRDMDKNQNGLGIGQAGGPSYTIDQTGAQSVAILHFSGQSLDAKGVDKPTGTLDTGGEQGSAPICMSTGQGGAEIMEDKAPTLNCNHEAPILLTGDKSHALRGEGFDASEDGTGRRTPILYENHANDSRITEVKKCPTMNSRMGTGRGNLPLVLSVHQNASGDIQTSENGFTVGTTGNASGRNTGKIMENNSIRRLTPGECSKLQGFPADHTAIPYKGKAVEQCPDGPRYKAIGNSWAVPCVRWIGERINEVEKNK